MRRYEQVLLRVFEKLFDDSREEIVFSQTDLREVADELGLQIRNFPDLIYNLRNRSVLPEEIVNAGYQTIEMRGRGQYALTKRSTDIPYPAYIEQKVASIQRIPAIVRQYLGTDEQCILSVVRYLDLLSDFLGGPCYHLQGHLRTTGSFQQQVEADDVYVMGGQGINIVIPIETKGIGEKLGLSQIRSTVDAVKNKFPSEPVIPVGIERIEKHKLRLIQFSCEFDDDTNSIRNIELVHARDYVLYPTLPNW